MSDLPTNPTPGIERMDPRMAARHFGERTRQIMERIDALPPHEMFTLAGELLTSGAEIRLAIAVANRAIDKLRVLAEAR